ncbi:MAG: hypothetical protein IBX61_02175 [Thermoleophilia bacterium]|nr:hypothetical protein [Thermoleophilia bacterium]
MANVNCPYCGMTNNTSCPEVMAECAYCGVAFAQIDTPYERLTIIDRNLPDAWERAEKLMDEWEEKGELDREVIVDRRLKDEEAHKPERRRLRGAGLPVVFRR